MLASKQVRHKMLKACEKVQNEVALFCEHDGICITFSPAGINWQALAPCTIKPWWLVLAPLKKQ